MRATRQEKNKKTRVSRSVKYRRLIAFDFDHFNKFRNIVTFFVTDIWAIGAKGCVLFDEGNLNVFSGEKREINVFLLC